MKLLSTLFVACGLMTVSIANAAVDADAAQAAVKESGCLTCHSVDKKKIGPSFKEVAQHHKGKAGAEADLVKHMTLKPMIDLDGTKTPHKALKNTDPAAAKNVAQWIMSL
jgi:cytochrome c